MSSPPPGMIAHYYCMACGLLLPNNARSPGSSTRLQCPHCHCEMELPSLPSPSHPHPLLSPSTPGGGSNSSVYSYTQEGQHSELDGGTMKDMRRLRLSSTGPGADASVSAFEASRSGTKGREEELESGDEGEDGGEDSQNNSRNSSRRSNKNKKKRDPLAPKRAANAYMLFCKEQRPLLKIREPELHFSVIGQRLGDMWRTLPSDEKKPYEDAAADDRDRYKSAMHHYTTSGMRSSMGERQLSGGGGEDWSSHYSSPMMMGMNGNGHGHMPPYPYHHRPSDPLPFNMPPPVSSSAPASTPTSPYTQYTPSRYQPYPTHSSSSSSAFPFPPSSSSSPTAAQPSSYAHVKRPRSYSNTAPHPHSARSHPADYGAPLDRTLMSEQEYFTKLYYYTVQQQKIINEEIRRYGRQRTQFAQLPVELQRQMMAQMAAGAGRGGDGMIGMPPGYERGDSTSSVGLGGGGGSAHMPSSLPPFMPDLLDGGMEESVSYNNDEHHQPPHQPWDFSEHMR